MKTIFIVSWAIFLSLNVFAQNTTITYWTNGNKKTEGVLKDSAKTGVWKTWHETGQLRDSGSYVPLNIGIVRIYIDSVKCALYLVDTLEIKKTAIEGKKETKTGQWVKYHKNGKKLEEGSYVSLAYIAVDFTKNAKNELVYAYGRLEPMKIGNWKYFNSDGTAIKVLEQEYRYGIAKGYGHRIEYFPNGKKKLEGDYDEANVRYFGLVKEWDENGKLIKESTFDKSGVLINEKKY